MEDAQQLLKGKLVKAKRVPEDQRGEDLRAHILGLDLQLAAVPVLQREARRQPASAIDTAAVALALQQLVRAALVLCQMVCPFTGELKMAVEQHVGPWRNVHPPARPGGPPQVGLSLEPLAQRPVTAGSLVQAAALLVTLNLDGQYQHGWHLADRLLQYLEQLSRSEAAALEAELLQLAGQPAVAAAGPSATAAEGAAAVGAATTEQEPTWWPGALPAPAGAAAAAAAWLAPAPAPVLTLRHLRQHLLVSRQRAGCAMVQQHAVPPNAGSLVLQQALADCQELIESTGGSAMMRDRRVTVLMQVGREAEACDEMEAGMCAAEASKSWFMGANQAYKLASSTAGGDRGKPFHVPTVRSLIARGDEWNGRSKGWLLAPMRRLQEEGRQLANQMLSTALMEHAARAQRRPGRPAGGSCEGRGSDWVMPSSYAKKMPDIGLPEFKLGDKCAECGKCRLELKKCAGCGQVRYCSRECQLKHWKQGGHKRDCAMLASLFGTGTGGAGGSGSTGRAAG